MNDIIPEFKTRTGAQKVHVVCLTDGDGNPLRAGKKYVDREGQSHSSHHTWVQDISYVIARQVECISSHLTTTQDRQDSLYLTYVTDSLSVLS